MTYLYEAEIHVARFRLLRGLGLSQEAEAELLQALDACADAASNYGYRGIALPEHVRPSPEIVGVWEHFYDDGASWAQSEAEDYAKMIAFTESQPTVRRFHG